VVIYYSCHGCCGGCYGCYGCCGGVVVQPGQPYKPPAPKPDDKKKEETAKPNQATIIVQVPAEAKMFVDGNEANLTSTSRRFITPALEMGRDYFYTIRAEKTRKGEKVAESKRVVFRAGQTVKVNFGDMSTAKVVPQAAPASVTVRLPADARLSVDGIECPLTSATRTFNTPKLDPGQRYVYTLKAEIVREGQTRADSKRVFVEAGKKVDVDFTNLPTLQAASR
jgi:uncharacterized protein (TIGR03000 family)